MYKIFLSPSRQWENTYSGVNTNEGEQMGRVAEYAEKALKRCGFDVLRVHDAPMSEKVKAADQYGADLYVPIHSNAFNNKVTGTRLFCSTKGGKGWKACHAIFDHLAPLTPGTSENIKINTGLFEIRTPKAPTAYIETEFHDVPETAHWIVDHVEDLAEAITHGICDFFGVPYVTPDGETNERLYRVQVGSFSNREYAEKFLETVREEFPDAFIVTVDM